MELLDTCQPLNRELMEEEAAIISLLRTEYQQTGKCRHVVVGLYESNLPPWHGCLACGKPIA